MDVYQKTVCLLENLCVKAEKKQENTRVDRGVANVDCMQRKRVWELTLEKWGELYLICSVHYDLDYKNDPRTLGTALYFSVWKSYNS